MRQKTVMGVGPRTLVWVDRAGNEEPINAPTGYYIQPKVSPDGKYVALTVANPITPTYILTWDLIRETATPLTLDEANNNTPLWTPDGKQILFSSTREGKQGIYSMVADGSGEIEKDVSVLDRSIGPLCFSDAKTLILLEMYEGSEFSVGVLSMERDRTPMTLLRGATLPQISPDGQ